MIKLFLHNPQSAVSFDFSFYEDTGEGELTSSCLMLLEIHRTAECSEAKFPQ